MSNKIYFKSVYLAKFLDLDISAKSFFCIYVFKYLYLYSKLICIFNNKM